MDGGRWVGRAAGAAQQRGREKGRQGKNGQGTGQWKRLASKRGRHKHQSQAFAELVSLGMRSKSQVGMGKKWNWEKFSCIESRGRGLIKW